MANSPNFCLDCIYWEKISKRISGDEFGICHSKSVAMKIALDGSTHLGEEGTFWTSSYFGCVHWRDRGNQILDFSKIIDTNTGKPIK